MTYILKCKKCEREVIVSEERHKKEFGRFICMKCVEWFLKNGEGVVNMLENMAERI